MRRAHKPYNRNVPFNLLRKNPPKKQFRLLPGPAPSAAGNSKSSKTKRGKYLFGVSLTSLLAVFAAAGITFAVVTISQNIQIGSGTPDLTLDGDDLYVTGTAEVDGTLAAKTGGAATFVVAASDASDRMKQQADYVADGTADDVQIQAAIDALPVAGGTVSLSEGLFNISSAINLRTGTKLEGQGLGSVNDAADDDGVTVLKATTAITIIQAIDVSYFQIADMKIRGGSGGIYIHETGGGADVRFFRLDRLVINGVTFDNPNAFGIRILGTTGGGLLGGFFMNDIHLKRVNGNAVNIRHAFDFFMTNIYAIATVDHGIIIRDASAIQGTNIRADFAGPGAGGEADGIRLSNVRHVVLTNVGADQNNAAGLRMLTSGGQIAILGGWFRDNGRDSALATHLRVGMSISSLVTNVSVMGVHLYNENTTNMKYGILDVGATHSITGNTIVGAAVAPMRNITAGAIVRDNQGFVTESSGTSTIPSAATSTTVTHGLSRTPAARDCSINPTNDLGTATKFWADTFGASEFTINVDADPGASTATFAWTCQVL